MNTINFRKSGMLLFCGLCFCLASAATATAQLFNQTFPEETLTQRIKKLEEKTRQAISFDAGQAQGVTAPSFTAQNCTLAQALDSSLRGTGYRYQYKNNAYVVYKDTKKSNTATKGKVRGVILDENNELLPGASISVVKGNQGAVADADGKFSLELPSGVYTLEVAYIGYQPQQITDVKISGGKTTPLDVKLGELNNQLSEVVVTANYNQASAQGLYARQKNVATMSDGVSADLIKKTGDSNVAQVLKRVSGVTIDKGKYVTVRGMGERYNNVQLNGASLPSTEPNRRNFSFDVIPTGLVDNITIAKTFTPDLPGEFTGGLVQVNTLAIPQKKIVKLGVGTGYNTLSTGKKFLSNTRFKNDWLLGEVDKRKWYSGYAGYGMKERAEIMKKNAGEKNTFGLRKYTAMPKQKYNLTVGLPFQIGKSKAGVIAALTYAHSENIEEIAEGMKVNGDSIYKPGTVSKAVTSAGLTLNAGWQLPGHKITLRNLFNNRFSHKNAERYYHDQYDFFEGIEQYSTPLQSRLLQSQLEGEHKLFHNKLLLSWNASYNKVKRTNPDDRLATGNKVAETPEGTIMAIWKATIQNAGNISIREGHTMYNGLEEVKKNAGINFKFPFEVQGNMQHIKAGYLGTFREADFQQQYLAPIEKRRYESSITPSLEDLFAPENFNENGPFTYTQRVTSFEGLYYTGEQNIHAGYLMGEFSFFKKLRLIAGARVEYNEMETLTGIATTKAGKEEILVDSLFAFNKTDLLPAATLIYSFTPELNLRTSYSKTLARPDFRELSQVNYYNVDNRVLFKTLEPVEQSHSYNYDARIEWYPRAGEVLSAGIFYKDFRKPVEKLIRVADNDHQTYSVYNINLDKATAKGMELNWRKSLGFVAPSVGFLDKLYLTGNFTWMQANVTYNMELLERSHLELTKEEKEKFDEFDRSRPLQGLSPYALNAGLSYRGECLGATVNYNRNGRKLLFAGEYKKSDQFLNPRDVVDVQLAARFLQNKLELKLNVLDLLNQDMITYMNKRVVFGKNEEDGNTGWQELDLTDDMDYNKGDWVLSRIRKGVSFSFSASYRF